MIRLCVIAASLLALLWSGQAQALVVTYDLASNQGPITLRVEADDTDADTRLRFRSGVADISSLLDITLTFGGTDYTLIGAIDNDQGLFDRNERTLNFVVDEVTRPLANTLTMVSLTFSDRVRRLRTIGDLFAYLEQAQIIGGNLRIAPGAAAAVPLPGAAVLFACGSLGGALLRRRRSFKF